MSYKLVTKQASAFHAEDVVDDVSEGTGGEYVYYVFVGNPSEYENPVNGVDVIYDNEAEVRKAYRNMLFGKMITPENVNLVIPRYEYVVNKIYDAYDDTTQDFFTKTFYVAVKNGTDYDVFKCLDNNNKSPSTATPSRLEIGSGDQIYRTADNYVWKYMYTADASDMARFATDTFMPVMANTQVSDAAVAGSIDVIKVDYSGSRYDNYLSGGVGASDLNVGGSKYKISVSGNNSSSQADDFYNGCIFKIVRGTGIGTYAKVLSYDGASRVVTVDKLLTIGLDSIYEISPGVVITGDYYQTINAEARAIVNAAAANGIAYIEILNRGADYQSASAFVYAANPVPVSNSTTYSPAVIRPIMPPRGGHGSNANNELGASRVCFSMTFDYTQDGFPTKNDFRQVGVMTNPRFSNVVVHFSDKVGNFQTGENLYAMNPVRLYGSGITVNTSSNTVTATTGDFANSISAGQYVYLSGSGTQQLAQVHSLTNATSMVLTSRGAFSCNDTQAYLAQISGKALVTQDDVDQVTIDDAYMKYNMGDQIIGAVSGAYGVVDYMTIDDQTTILDKFNQTWKYSISTSDTFLEDEVVFQGLDTSRNHALLHSVNGSSNPKLMFVTNQFGIINTGDRINGQTSKASAEVLNKYQPDLIFNSGRIVYLENLEPVVRESGQKETFKIIFEY